MKRYKKLFMLTLSLLLVFALSACSSSDKNTSTNKIKTNSNTKILVAYFSCTGTTKSVAKNISDSLDATLFEIKPKEPYTSEDLNYNDENSRVSIEHNDKNAKVDISNSVSNMNEYDIVFIGYPIWWDKAPKIINTFLESYDFSGKTIVPFCTSASSDINSSVTDLKKLTSNSTNLLYGKRFSSNSSKEDITNWLSTLNLEK